MTKKEFALVAIEIEPTYLDIDSFAEVCHLSPDFILELVEYGILEPKGTHLENWQFGPRDLYRVRRLMRLQQDLEVNLPGAVLALDLLQQIEDLRAQLQAFEKYFSK